MTLPTPLVIVVGMLKGGTGKTTTAMFTALWWARVGRQVLLLDCDPTSQSAHDWAKLADRAGQPLPFTVTRYPFEDLGEYIGEMRKAHDVIVVDAGGGSTDLLKRAVAASDIVLVPLAPAGADVRRVQATVSAATEAAQTNRGGTTLHVLVVRADRRTSQPEREHARLVAGGLPVLDTMIGDYVHYSDAYGGVPADTYEYAQVMKEIGAGA